MSNSDVRCASAREITTPSTCTATPGSLPVVDVLAPMPRMKIFAMLKSLPKVIVGTICCRSSRLLICADSSLSALTAVTAALTSWSDCSRFCAVTMISSIS